LNYRNETGITTSSSISTGGRGRGSHRGRSSPPVDSITVKWGMSLFRDLARRSMPVSSFASDQLCAWGTTATSKRALETSLPTKHCEPFIVMSSDPLPCGIWDYMPLQLFGLLRDGT
jgi:hypothetical protein